MALGVGRLLLLTAGRAALQRALPLYVALVIGASIVFGGDGLSPATLAELSVHSWPFRVALHLGWAPGQARPSRLNPLLGEPQVPVAEGARD
jgi:hypothetical protein